MNSTKFILTLSILILSIAVQAQSDFERILRSKIPSVKSVLKIDNQDHFTEEYEVLLEQPLDHNDASAGTFEQRIFLSHTGFKNPVLLVTEGYAARQRTYELSKILNSNQIIVEYRFFGRSVPKNKDWKYLKNDQAMEDLHRIRTLFKKVYRSQKWVSTGISKGGSTTLIYKSKYPKDVKLAVPYVAPLALAMEDKRTDEHIMQIGTKECRKKLNIVQRAALKQRNKIIPMIDKWAKKNKQQFTFLTTDKVLEYAVLEYTFSFWQWGHDCNKIPPANASAKVLFEHINEIVGYDFYSDATVQYFQPAFYQFITELGYYGFINKEFQDLLVSIKKPTNKIFAPQDTDLTFTPYCQDVVNFLDKKGKKVLYIYGEVDPWTACGYQPTKKTKALRMDKKGGSHFTRIASFSNEERARIYNYIRKHSKVTPVPLPENVE